MPWHSCKTGFHCLALDSAIKIAHSAWRSATLISLSAHWLILLYINISCCLLEENEFSLICSLNICFKLFRNLLQNLSHILERNVYFVVCMSCPICRKKRIIKTSRIKKNRKCFNLNNLCTFFAMERALILVINQSGLDKVLK